MEINDFQKHLYNTYLKILAKNSKRAYKNRKNFDSIKNETKITLEKIEKLIKSNGIKDLENFFQAGFSVLHRQFVQLEFFYGYKAIVAYKKTRTNKE